MSKRKILYLTPYIYYPEIRSFSRNKTGFGMVTWEIAKQFAHRGDKVYILTSTLSRSETIEGVKIIGLSIWDLFIKSLYFKTPYYLFLLNKSGRKGRSKLALMKNLVVEGYVSEVIKRINPDIVHIHGLSPSTTSFINPVAKSVKPMVITLHGLISLDRNILISPYIRQYEQEIIRYLSNQENVFITYISSGMLQIIRNTYNIKNNKNMFLIPNGVNIKKFYIHSINKIKLKKKYKIPLDKKVIINVNSLSKRKNQIFILETINKIKKELRDNILLLLIGEGSERKNLEAYIYKNQLDNNVKLLGFKSGEELIEYYNIADLSVITSTSEGFGIPIIESYASGVPVLTFSDLEAVNDLYNPNCMMLVKNRDINDFGEEIIKAVNKEWDKPAIKKHVEKFSWEQAIDKYNTIYTMIENSDKKFQAWEITLEALKKI